MLEAVINLQCSFLPSLGTQCAYGSFPIVLTGLVEDLGLIQIAQVGSCSGEALSH